MTRDDIIKMAREAGLHDPMVFYAGYERFAALVAAAEREACAKVCDAHESLGDGYMGDHFRECAAEIRARGKG